MNLNSKKGFTLIETLVVVSIIGLLSSVFLVGLGGFRSRGRDARRIADLRQVQNALELYYSKNSAYPALSCTSSGSRTCWDGLETTLAGAGIGVAKIANDPNSAQSYMYASDGQNYTLGARFQGQDPVLNDDIDGTSNGIDCIGGSPETVYCLQF
ncbi:MAG: type II secretion system protein [Candidatus Harrisonbacteria bacterium]|nr:type II secretion system protein [Candidatus Harrisonbacteria bacterium]